MRSIALFCLLLASMQTSFAQSEFRWNEHGVGFSVPDDFHIEANNAEEFSAGNEVLFLSIVPIQDENITEDNLAEALVAMAEEMEYDRLEKVAETTLQDFVGYYTIGTKDGANALLMTLLDTQSSTNLLIVIVYADQGQRAAIQIANSFFAYD